MLFLFCIWSDVGRGADERGRREGSVLKFSALTSYDIKAVTKTNA